MIAAAVLALATTPASPWQVGPAPSAHATEPGYAVGASLGGAVAGRDPLWGGRARAQVTPHRRAWTSVEFGYGYADRLCLDCRALALRWAARGTIIDHTAIHAAAWSSLSVTQGVVDWIPGLAIEAGGSRLRVDTSWPVWATFDMLSLLRATPELGLSARWSARHRTRVALVGLEPAVAVTHRVFLRYVALEATARYGEEGLGLMVGARFHAGWARNAARAPRG